ncbi:MAG: translocation/assembly module TamB domain-containing protein [Pseudomonadota bacterium]
MADDATIMEPGNDEAPEARPARRKWLKWLLRALALILVPLLLGAAFLSTPLGKRFVADQIAQISPASGLRFTIGRIEGDLLHRAVLRDVRVLDPQGEFLRIPEATVDWRPLAWLWSGLDIRELTARRARLGRLPELLPGDPDAPVLPSFDIRMDRLEIDNLTLAEGVAGKTAQRVDVTGKIDIRSGRTLVEALGQFGPEDRIALTIDAEPDGDRFDMALDYAAAADGPIAALLGLTSAYRAEIKGEGTWSSWLGNAVFQREEEAQTEPLAEFKMTNAAGRYGIDGYIKPTMKADTILARALGDRLALKLEGTLKSSRFDGVIEAKSSALDARGKGLVDFSGNAFEGFEATLALLDPELLGDAARIEGGVMAATLNGRWRELVAVHEISMETLEVSGVRLDQLTQQGVGRVEDGALILPLETKVARVETDYEQVNPRLVRGTLLGSLLYAKGRLRVDRARLSFPELSAVMSVEGDIPKGSYAISGPVKAQSLEVPELGLLSGTAEIDYRFGASVPWTLGAEVEAQLSDLRNESVASVLGANIEARATLNVGRDTPLTLGETTLVSEKIDARFDTRRGEGSYAVNAQGEHSEYGPFSLEAQFEDTGPRAQLVLADPYPSAGLQDVALNIAPRDGGFAIGVAGGSSLGPFQGDLGLRLPENAPARLDIERLRVDRTRVSGEVTLADTGPIGDLILAGGGLDGTISIAPAQGGATGFDVDLVAEQARFSGPTPLSIASADVSAVGRVGGDAEFQVEADVSGSGFEYGALRIVRFAVDADVRDGQGAITGSIAGNRADRFGLNFDARFAPQSISLLARGEYAGRAITMPTRAVFTRLDGGGYQLAPAQLGFARGFVILEGQFGGAQTDFEGRFARVPLRLADLAGAGLGLSGRLSGTVAYRRARGGDPTASARVEVQNFARSGLVLSSKPVDIVAGLDLTAETLVAAATVETDGTRLGRVDARITDFGPGETVAERLRDGRLSANLSYDGAAEALWRLAAIDSFDLTGPAQLYAQASGTLSAPSLTGSVASDNLRLQSAILGTDLSAVRVRGRFDGAQLQLTRFSGNAPEGGRVQGSGTVDLGTIETAGSPALDLKLAADRANLLDAFGLEATVTGPMRIVSDGRDGTIAGRLVVDEASWRLGYAAEDLALPEFEVEEVNLTSEMSREAQRSSPAGSWRYLIDAKSYEGVEVEGLGIDSVWGVDIALRGTVDEPRLGGEARLVRGDYTFAGTRFDLERGRITFDEIGPIDPQLDIIAETSKDNIDVTVTIGGTSEAPQVAFASEPALPDEEILSRLLFGDSVTSLSATDAVQLAAALASLRGGSGTDPIGSLRDSIGLDQLRIVSADPAIGRETGVALGKNITRGIYAEIITDGRGYSATQVEYRVTSWLSLLGTVSTIGRDRVSVQVSRDY